MHFVWSSTIQVLLAIVMGLTLLSDGVVAKGYEELGKRHQGDIVLSDFQYDAVADGGALIVQDASKWTKGIVPYEFSPSFTEPEQGQIVEIMNRISSYSCVRFVPRTSKDKQFLNITAIADGCWTTLGMNPLSNQLNLHKEGCLQSGVIMHQLLHVLGFTHPQSRPDRDFYVLVQEDAIEPSLKQNLDKYLQGGIEDFGIPYDYESLLHCKSDAFGSSTSDRATVVPMDDVEIGQRDQLSLKDVRKLNKMYDYEFCGHCVRGNCNSPST
ncbi:zinc metalloproteinase nas-14-like [Anopheles nili]|uniref:zinc metalloproteinase nas-14-like n=1 Tax=Anopheles nili TaxID=185578 RepID=UPI00237A7CFA|nr:zinc metalloproteinase nas-14-like [Anopheles nili]